mmetsp:Transcript_82859/g.242930  ORF Transcript_82859/g.242930 Transcript_82859/m.242930 type:complete len:250 (-) Transcript_82859:385-1134(-)
MLVDEGLSNFVFEAQRLLYAQELLRQFLGGVLHLADAPLQVLLLICVLQAPIESARHASPKYGLGALDDLQNGGLASLNHLVMLMVEVLAADRPDDDKHEAVEGLLGDLVQVEEHAADAHPFWEPDDLPPRAVHIALQSANVVLCLAHLLLQPGLCLNGVVRAAVELDGRVPGLADALGDVLSHVAGLRKRQDGVGQADGGDRHDAAGKGGHDAVETVQVNGQAKDIILRVLDKVRVHEGHPMPYKVAE